MINVIIRDVYCDAVNIKSIIERHMMNYDEDINYYLFDYENKNFRDNIKNIKGFNVYILSYDLLYENGIECSKYIRNELEDWNSVIILITNHYEMRNELINNRLFIFDLIYKNIYLDKILKQDLDNIRKYYYNRHNFLTFESNRIIKKLDFRNIYMIKKEKDSKKCVIKTSFGNYYTCESLNSVNKRLDSRFIKINRGCIVNGDKIIEYNASENKLTFKSGVISYDISRDNKRKITSKLNSYK